MRNLVHCILLICIKLSSKAYNKRQEVDMKKGERVYLSTKIKEGERVLNQFHGDYLCMKVLHKMNFFTKPQDEKSKQKEPLSMCGKFDGCRNHVKRK